MQPTSWFDPPAWLAGLEDLLLPIGIGLAVMLLVALTVLLIVSVWVRHLDIPEGAGFVDTLRVVPLGIAVCLDLLDMALDIFGAPIVWVFMGRYKLKGLRTVTTVQALIPGTQLVPILTLAWMAVRLHGRRR